MIQAVETVGATKKNVHAYLVVSAGFQLTKLDFGSIDKDYADQKNLHEKQFCMLINPFFDAST